ncbi:type II toxin-antitoxin system RelE/ParE family toxin [Oxalobacteraceae bacterium OTU3CINTB1]|nr:type II toxin-antitoxin system RelE/ParE family toxin [Oxalobacteraceae bacterium OTU3CINTB1]
MNLKNQVTWTPKAVRQLRKLPPEFQLRVFEAADTLEQMPNCPQVLALKNHPYRYRLRVGNFRVLFDWSTVIKIVEIQEVKKRDEGTY